MEVNNLKRELREKNIQKHHEVCWKILLYRYSEYIKWSIVPLQNKVFLGVNNRAKETIRSKEIFLFLKSENIILVTNNLKDLEFGVVKKNYSFLLNQDVFWVVSEIVSEKAKKLVKKLF